jgi:sugar lactone lactonase YvrE
MSAINQLKLVGAAMAFVGAAFLPEAASASSTLTGVVATGESRIIHAVVTLYRAGRGNDEPSAVLGSAVTGADGGFSIEYSPPRAKDVLYVIARRGSSLSGPWDQDNRLVTPTTPFIALAAVLGTRDSVPAKAHVNELTTVATAYAMSRFLSGKNIAGPSPGLQNAAGTAANLADVATGALSTVLATRPNGPATSTRAQFNSLANLLAACIQGLSKERCELLNQFAWSGRGAAPSNTLEAIHQIARNPWNNVEQLFALSRTNSTYRPRLDRRHKPDAWTIALTYKGNGRELNGPGNMAIDKDGNVWSTNNFEFSRNPTKSVCGGKQVIKLTPTGEDAAGAPYSGGGVDGAGFGIAVDQKNRAWVANFGFFGVGCDDPPPADSVSLFSSTGKALSPRKGFRSGAINGPQGTVVDRKGNVWIANFNADDRGRYSITKYVDGNPDRARDCRNSLLDQPFDLAIDHGGNVWVSNSGGDTVIKLAPDCTLLAAFGQPGTQSAGMFKRPLGLAVDSRGNVWVSNSLGASVTRINADGKANQFFGGGLNAPWGLSVDGDDHVFVANFSNGQSITELCGSNERTCPIGIGAGDPISPLTGYTSDALVRLTGIEIDPSGNVWVANNFQIKPAPNNPGGRALVVFVGLAAPVKTPLIGPPERP